MLRRLEGIFTECGGVRGYVLKKQAAVDLVRAIREVAAGRVYLSPGISAAVAEAVRSPVPLTEEHLTAREREVLQLVAEGKTTKEIAVILGGPMGSSLLLTQGSR